ncbi:hypothetical protein DN552_30630, partial [Burkholderia multivorans]
ADLVVLDVCLAVMDVFLKDFGDQKYRGCRLVREMVAAGRLGGRRGGGCTTTASRRHAFSVFMRPPSGGRMRLGGAASAHPKGRSAEARYM